MTRRRPGWIPTLLLAFFAATMVVAFNRGEFYVAWFVGLGGSFLTMELWHARVRSGDTFSEDWWDVLGIRPRRALRLLRTTLAGIFLEELGAHIVLGGAYWFCGSWAIGGTAVPLSCVVGYSLVFERRRVL